CIDVRRIDHRAAGVDERVQDGGTCGLVGRPVEHVAAQRQRRDFYAAVANRPLVHAASPFDPSPNEIWPASLPSQTKFWPVVHHLFVKFSDTHAHVGEFDRDVAVNSVVALWSYALAACAFASVVLWRLRSRADRTERLLIASCAATAIWATIAAVYGRTDPMTMVSGTLRNLIWMVLLYEMSGGVRGSTWSGMRLVFAAVALSIGLH